MKDTNFKIIIGFLILCVAAALVGNMRPKIESSQFVGQISDVTDKSMKVNGFYKFPENPELEKYDHPMDVTVKVDRNTNFKKTVLHYPSPEELKVSGGRYEVDKLRQEVVEGTIEDLKNGNVDGVYAHSNGNVYERDEFTASVIEYRIMLRPE